MSDAVAESAYGALEMALEKLNSGEYNAETAKAVVDVIFRSFNPLMAGKDFGKVCVEASKEIEASYSPKIVRIYSLTCGETHSSASIQMIDTTVRIGGNSVRNSKMQFDTRPEAYAYVKRVLEVLKKQGYLLE